MSGRSILLWVLIPFVGLCALALWLTRPAPTTPPPTGPHAHATPPGTTVTGAPDLVTPPQPARAPPPVLPPPDFPTARGGPPLVPPGAPPAALSAAEDEAVANAASQDPVIRQDVRTALRAVRPLLDRCFSDVAERNPGLQSATLRFTVEGEHGQGHFREGVVVNSSVQDPMLQACLEDSLLDARFPAPRSGERLSLTYPYRYHPPPRPGRPQRPEPPPPTEAGPRPEEPPPPPGR